jgi:2-oxoglutarate dehydrogenase E1 component
MLEPTPLYGGNAEFVDALYEQYLRDPASVDEHWREYFAQLAAPGSEPSHQAVRAAIAARAAAGRPAPATGAPAANARQAAVSRLIQVWINRGPHAATAAAGP